MERALLAACETNPLILKDPAPFARLSAHKDSALEFTVRVWTKNENYWDVYFDLLEKTNRAFEAAGIHVPFPQMDVHVKQ